MNSRIVNAIEEQTGLQYSSLPDAIHWYETPTAWRSDFMAVWNPAPERGVKHPLKQHKRTVKLMEHEVLEAVCEMLGERYKTIGEALKDFSKGEILGAWLRYTGGIGYTNLFLLLQVMEVIGYDVDPDE